MLQTSQGHSFPTHSLNITQPSLCPQVPGWFLLYSASVREHWQTWQRKRTWQRTGRGSSAFIPAPVPSAVLTWVSSSCELSGVFQERPLDSLSTSQVPITAYLCGLLWLWADKLRVQDGCHLNKGFCLSNIFLCMANRNNDLWIYFHKILRTKMKIPCNRWNPKSLSIM